MKRLENGMKTQQAQTTRAQEEFHAERNKLFTDFSHELRTSLMLIINPLNDMSEHPESLSEAQKGKIALMQNSAQRLLRLVNNLTDFCRNGSGTATLKPATSDDERFMRKLYEVMEKNISNPDFKLEAFSRETGMSKASLYRKLKSVTDFSPNAFIRNFRLETSARIIKNTDLPISEVYVAVGFGSHAYFSNCFKTLYGISPTAFAGKGSSRPPFSSIE
jgi:AraC-like DNA-binding protein